jgi:membrane protein
VLKPIDVFRILKNAIVDFIDDEAMSLGAAVSYYSALSLAPLLLLLLWIAGLLGPDVHRPLVAELTRLIGPEVGTAIGEVMKNARQETSARTLSGIVGLATLLISASAVFAELQHAMNVIWNVKPKPGAGFGDFIKKRLLSLGMVISVGFLLLVSMAASAAVSGVIEWMSGAPASETAIWRLVDIGSSFVLYAFVFGAMFKVLPDVKIPWKNVIAGALITATLFVAGKVLVGLYLGYSSMASSYGAAGSLVVLLAWVYYSAQIVFLGAEIVQAYAAYRGSPITPESHAEVSTPPERAQPKAVQA